MNLVHVLDCTLRDGGYCNQWEFGYNNIKKITAGLVESGIEIIECGFLTSLIGYNPDVTKFNSIDKIARIIPENRDGKMFVAMINYGEFNLDDLSNYDGSSIDGIRIAFHKNNVLEALEWCKIIKAKGYNIFIQAMISLNYTDNEFLSLINQINDIQPYAFYIVDSFGMMKRRDLIRLFYMVEHNLDSHIWIGFHSHNNMQLAFSNAQTLAEIQTNRNLILDSSIYGMGRGAGNLNTELLIEYLNDIYDKKYVLKPLLTIIDEILDDFYKKNYWGYSLPNYISAKNSTHPSYAGFLDDKKTITVEDMDNIFQLMDNDKKVRFDKQYIEDLYTRYLESGKVQEIHKTELVESLAGKKVLLIAPGKSASEESQIITEELKRENVVGVSINYNYSGTDYIFMSNIRRFKDLEECYYDKCIVTSNIISDKVFLQTKYKDLLNKVESVKDNAGLMALFFFVNCGVTDFELAGFDGYSHDIDENYANNRMQIITRNAVLDAINDGMNRVLKKMSEKVNITLLTTPKYIRI